MSADRFAPSLNGTGKSRDDFYAAAGLLYEELKELNPLPWFIAVEADEAAGRLIVEARDLAAAQRWCQGGWLGWPVDVRRGRAIVTRGACK